MYKIKKFICNINFLYFLLQQHPHPIHKKNLYDI